ncbi:MAG: cation transporter [Gemmatimonadaceae bacterium]|nr:cation transporter [Gemmatimonadaceae bacterium]
MLWVALAINVLMFGVEIIGGVSAGSSALQADALDFLGDAANYGISLFVLSSALRVRAHASRVKGASMAAFGCWVVGHALYQTTTGAVPEPTVMSVLGVLALAANVLVALLLYRYRTGDSNMRSVWICSRNDALGNIAVVAAAAGVFTTQHGWPDIAVALIMGLLSLSGAWQILRHAREATSTEAQRTPSHGARCSAHA